MHPPYYAVQRKLTHSPAHHTLASPHMTSSPVHPKLCSGENTVLEPVV